MIDRKAVSAAIILCTLSAATLCVLDGRMALAARTAMVEAEEAFQRAREASESPRESRSSRFLPPMPDRAAAEADLRSLILESGSNLESYAGSEEGRSSFGLIAGKAELLAFLSSLHGRLAAPAVSAIRISRSRDGARVCLELDHGNR